MEQTNTSPGTSFHMCISVLVEGDRLMAVKETDGSRLSTSIYILDSGSSDLIHYSPSPFPQGSFLGVRGAN